MRKALLVAAGVAAFATVLAVATLRQTGVSCEVCMEVGGRSLCSTVVAASTDDALAEARRNACDLLTEGMTAELACQRTMPRSSTCRE